MIEYRVYGLLLKEIMIRTGHKKAYLHERLKAIHGISSLKDLTTEQMWGYITELKAYFAHRGIILREPGETDFIENMSMEYFLKQKL